MATEPDDRDIEIIPPDRSGSRGQKPEWIYIDATGDAKSFSDIPFHKKLLLGAATLAGLVLAFTIVFLVVASAVFIWIPLLLAIGLLAAGYAFFRRRVLRR